MKEQIFSILSGMRPEYDFSTSQDFISDGMLDSFDVVTLGVKIVNLVEFG